MPKTVRNCTNGQPHILTTIETDVLLYLLAYLLAFTMYEFHRPIMFICQKMYMIK